MTETPTKPQSTVTRIAQGLRTIALSLEPGEYIGSEESLSRKFNVTGPTLRQAVRLLEHEQVIQVRRGVRGGYFADRPNIDTISRVAAVYMRSRLNSFDETRAYVEYMQPFLVDLVLANDRLDELEPYAYPAKPLETYDEAVAEQTAFGNLLWGMADNAPLQLIYAIFFEFGSGVELQPVTELSEGILKLQQVRIELARALLERDRDRAIELAVALNRIVHLGIKQNLIDAQERAKSA